MPQPSSRSGHSFSEIPLSVTRRLTESGKKQIRETCIHFVSRTPLSKMMEFARRLLLEAGIADSLIRMTEEDYLMSCLQKETIRNQVFGIFVLDQLSGSLYDELWKRSKEEPKCRIVRPLAIVMSKRGSELCIPFKKHPLCSLALHSEIRGITLSGDLMPDERRDLSRKILLMGGNALASVKEQSTSLLVARTMTDQRCIIARSSVPPIPIVSPEWVYHCFQQSERDVIVRGIDNYSKFMLLPFAGITISPAQISVDLRRKLQTGAAKFGFTYLPDLDRDKTTHLVCESADSKKWKAAQKWKMHCVSYTWVVHSVESGYALPEKRFRIRPQDEDDDLSFRSLTQSFGDESRLHRKRSSKDRRTQIPGDESHDIRKVSRRNQQDIQLMDTEDDGPSLSLPVNHLTQTLSRGDDSPVQNQSFEAPAAASANDSFSGKYSHLLSNGQDGVFDGLEFNLISCDTEKAAFFKKLIQSHSGFVGSRISESVHYVLVGKEVLDDTSQSMMQTFRSNDFSATFVSYKWLIECAERGRLVDTEPFSFSEKRLIDEDESSSASAAAEQPNLGFKVTKRLYSAKRKAVERAQNKSQTPSFEESIPDDDLRSAYASSDNSTQTKSWTTAESADDDSNSPSFDPDLWKKVRVRRPGQQSEPSDDEMEDSQSVVSDASQVSFVSGFQGRQNIAVTHGSSPFPKRKVELAKRPPASKILDAQNEFALYEKSVNQMRPPSAVPSKRRIRYRHSTPRM